MGAERAARVAPVDGLRAIAALAVLGSHAAFYSGFTSAGSLGAFTARLNVGVALFFVLSAFLLYRPWVAARLDGGPRPGVGRYALRRATRILPAYWLALVVLGIVLSRHVPGVFGADWWAFFGLLQAYSQDTVLSGIGPAWSLCVEVAFYAVLPVLAWLVSRALAGRPRDEQVRLELVGLAVSVVLALGLRALVDRTEAFAQFNVTVVGRWPWFAVGIALAIASAAWAGRPAGERPALLRVVATRAWPLWAAAAGVLALSAALLPREVLLMTDRQLELETVLFALFALLLVAPVVLGADAPDRGPRRVLAAPVVVWLGTVSYGIFLWHDPFVQWVVEWAPPGSFLVVVLLTLAVTLPVAAASWYVVERPVMRWSTRRASARPDRADRRPAPALEPAP